MAYVPNLGSVVGFQSDPTKLVGTVSVVSSVPQSVSGTVQAQLLSTNASIITVGGATGNSSVQVLNFPANQSVSGTVGTTQQGTWISSIVNTVPSSVIVGASIFGLPPVNVTNTNLNVGGSVVAFQGAGWSGSVAAQQVGTRTTSLVSTVPSSVIVGSSIFGQLPAGTAMLGSIAAYQGAIPWTINSIYGNISGSVAAIVTNANLNVSGSVIAFQGTNPWVVQSIVGTYAEDIGHTTGDKGIFALGIRNDTLASLVSADLDYGGQAQDSQGRQIFKPFASEDATIISYTGSVVSGSVTLIQASAIGKRNYITDYWIQNTGSTFGLLTFKDGSTSVLGYAAAPATGGSNSQGINIPLKTAPSQDLAFTVSPSQSILYLTVKGYQAP